MKRGIVSARELKARLDTGVPAALLKLADRRAITLPTRMAMGAFTPMRSGGRRVSQAVRDDRKDRF